MQAKNSNALALITEKRKIHNDAVFLYEDKKNASVSNQITTRSERTSISSVKVRVNEQQHRSTQDPEEEL